MNPSCGFVTYDVGGTDKSYLTECDEGQGLTLEKKQSKPAPIVGVMLLALSLLLAVGLRTFAAPCEAHGTGAVTMCHWACRVILGMDVVLGVIALVRVFEMDEGERRGLSFSAALVGALIAATPGWLIPLCEDATLRCQGTMRPFCLFVGMAVALVGGVDLTRRLLALRK